MNPKKFSVKCGLGIDISKDEIVACALPAKKFMTYKNDLDGIKAFMKEVKKIMPDQIILEPTSYFHRPLARKLVEAKFHTVVMNPGDLKKLADGEGRKCKTDKIDAYYFAKVAQHDDYPARELPSRERTVLRILCTFRSLLVEKRTDIRNGMNQAIDALELVHELLNIDSRTVRNTKSWFQKLMKMFDETIKALESLIQTIVTTCDEFHRSHEILTSVKGIGELTSAVLIGLLPELGKLNRGQIANLCGLAPLNHESGKFKGQRKVGHGRLGLKTALYSPIESAIRYNPTIKTYAERLKSRGKTGMQLKIACMRKLILILNQLLKTNQKWGENQPQTEPSAT